jgi:zinc D-Ala-D-Ala carboxypeptidase
MTKRTALHLCLGLVIVFTFAFFGFTGRGQERAQPATEQPLVKKQSLVVESTSTAAPAAKNVSVAAFAQAATQNVTLRDSIAWLFGGKQQRGWYLYGSLIGKLVSSENGPTTPEFAAALSSWQAKFGLPATGILDTDTLYKMVDTWQSIRTRDSAFPPADQLITAPPSEFFDPERPEELRQVRIDAYTAYKKMLAAAIADSSLNLKTNPDGTLAADEQFFKIISSYRSREYQEQLRRNSPHAGRAGLAVNSPHFTGRALDIYVGGEPVETRDTNRAIQVNTPVYKWLVKNAEKFGFIPYYYEPWHWEYKPSR